LRLENEIKREINIERGAFAFVQNGKMKAFLSALKGVRRDGGIEWRNEGIFVCHLLSNSSAIPKNLLFVSCF
jgi:hypothetical protein